MNIVRSYEELVRIVGWEFENRNKKAKMVGLLFAQPNSFTKEEILSGIDYFHNRSGNFIDFFCMGYQPDFFNKDLPIQAIVGNAKWAFDSTLFNLLREQIEQRTTWKYSGGIELVLFNAFYSENALYKVEFDFSDSLVLDLKKASDEKLVGGTGELFEKIFRISESLNEINPTLHASKELIKQSGKKSIVSIVFNLLPEAIKNEVKKIFFLGTESLNKIENNL